MIIPTTIWSMPFYVPDGDEGYQEWELRIVDKICNGYECVGGLTDSYPIALVLITEEYIFDTELYDGCTVLTHEIYHAWYGDWYHEVMAWCHV